MTRSNLEAQLLRTGSKLRDTDIQTSRELHQALPGRIADTALDAAARLHQRGFLVPAIRPPTVPEGTSRLRVSLSAAHTREEIAALAAALVDCVAA